MEDMKIQMDKRLDEYNKMVEIWDKREEEAKRRINYAIEGKEYTSDSFVYLYESGPMDHYEKWTPLHTFSHNILDKYMKGLNSYYDVTIENQIVEMERLLMMGLIHFSNIFVNDLRGELMHYTYSKVNDDELKYIDKYDTALAICLKLDNNGTMYAFSFSPYLTQNMPHEFGYDWILKDAQLTQFKK